MSDGIQRRVDLINHLEAKGDRQGVRLAYAAFDAAAYARGDLQQRVLEARLAAEELARPRGVVGEKFSVAWNGGKLSVKFADGSA
jgi:hypothetical protein